MGLIFLFNFASVLHKKYTILCNTKHELHKMECFFTALTPFVLLNFRFRVLNNDDTNFHAYHGHIMVKPILEPDSSFAP